jgi:MarR family transcriptional regulator, organic hydroperoxide resistance regulator
MLVDGSDELFRHVLYLMVLASARLATFREAIGRMIGLTGSQYLVLLATAHCQGQEGVTIRTLTQYVLMASTHVTTEVGALIKKGLLKKRPNGADGRSVLVSLTRKGERAMQAIAPTRCEFNDAFFVGIERKQLLAVAQFLEQVTRNSDRALPLLHRGEEGLRRRPATRSR